MVAIDLIPKQEQKPIFGQLFFVIISLAVFFSTVAGVVALEQLKGGATRTLDSLKKTLAEDTRPREQQLQAELTQYQAELATLQTILNEKMNLLAFLEFLEENTHPDIFFVSFDGNLPARTMTLEGEADAFFVLEQQRLVWKGRFEFENVSIRDIGIANTGRASFTAEFLASQEFLEPK